jgi:alkylation response protein AidB-like acyl-CoA dehydrogenase
MTAEARYHPSADQVALADAVNASLAELLPIARLHDAWEETPQTWAALDALGVFGVAVDEAAGGSGLGAAEESLIAFGLGRGLVAPAVLATLGAAHARADGACSADLAGRRTASGYRRGGRAVMIMEPGADFLLLREDADAAVYRAPVEATPLDEALWAARLAQVRDLGAPVARCGPEALLRLRLLDAAALAGLAEAALDMAVAYAMVREQFGRPIGAFQAVKHHCANMAIAARCARDQASFAAVAIDDGRHDAELQVECAVLTAGQAALANAGTNIQLHGGIGFSDEADPHLILKRARVLLAIAGGLEAASARVGAIKPNL